MALQRHTVMGTVQIIHRVDGQHQQSILLEFRLIFTNPQVHDSTSFDHFSQNLINIISIFAGPLGDATTEFGSIFCQKRGRRFTLATFGDLGKEFFQVIVKTTWRIDTVTSMFFFVVFAKSFGDAVNWINFGAGFDFCRRATDVVHQFVNQLDFLER